MRGGSRLEHQAVRRVERVAVDRELGGPPDDQGVDDAGRHLAVPVLDEGGHAGHRGGRHRRAAQNARVDPGQRDGRDAHAWCVEVDAGSEVTEPGLGVADVRGGHGQRVRGARR